MYVQVRCIMCKRTTRDVTVCDRATEKVDKVCHVYLLL